MKLNSANATAQEFENLARGLIGQIVRKVRFSGPFLHEEYPHGSLEASEVEIKLDHHYFLMRWEMRAHFHCLAFYKKKAKFALQQGSRGREFPQVNLKLPGVISEVRRAVYQGGESGQECLWAVNIILGSGEFLCISLGEFSVDGSLRYLPDSIVLINDADLARNYQPTTARSSAWGELIATE